VFLGNYVCIISGSSLTNPQTIDIQYTYDCKLKKIREMLLTTLEHNQDDAIDVI
jgi:hypothetical protein